MGHRLWSRQQHSQAWAEPLPGSWWSTSFLATKPEFRSCCFGVIPLLQSGGTVSSEQTRNQTDQTFCFRLFFVQVCDSPLRGDAFLYGSLIFRLLETRVVVDLTLSQWHPAVFGLESRFYRCCLPWSVGGRLSWSQQLHKIFLLVLCCVPVIATSLGSMEQTLRAFSEQRFDWFDPDLITDHGLRSLLWKIGVESAALFSGRLCWVSVFTQQWRLWCILHRTL